MFLVEKFQQFHADLERMVGRVAHGAWLFEGAEAPLDPDAPQIFEAHFHAPVASIQSGV